MNGIQTEGVEVIVLQPMERVLDKESPDLIAAGTVEVDGIAPRSSVTIRKVRRVCAKVVAFRAEMVVDHVEGDRQAMPVSGIDEALKRFGWTVSILRSKGIDAVITPISGTGKLGNGHQFKRANSQVNEV